MLSVLLLNCCSTLPPSTYPVTLPPSTYAVTLPLSLPLYLLTLVHLLYSSSPPPTNLAIHLLLNSSCFPASASTHAPSLLLPLHMLRLYSCLYTCSVSTPASTHAPSLLLPVSSPYPTAFTSFPATKSSLKQSSISLHYTVWHVVVQSG